MDKMFQKGKERLILLSAFLAPFSNIMVYKTGYVDLKILQILWTGIFSFILIEKAVSKHRPIAKLNTENLIFVVYIFALILSCLFSLNMAISLKELFQYIYLFLMMFIIYKNAQKKEFFDKIILAVIVSNALLVSVSLISYFSGRLLVPAFQMYPNGYIEIVDQLYKSQALVESKNIINRIDNVMGLSTVGIANCILIQSLIINFKIRNSSGKATVLYFCLFIANLVTICITYSRAALIIFIAINFITLLGKNRKLNFLLIIAAALSIPVILSMFPTIYERLLEAFNPQEGSTKYHFVFWTISLMEGYDHIFTGIGLGNAAFQQDMYANTLKDLFSAYDLYYADGANVHNFILQIWAEQGSIGIFANAILILFPIIQFIKVRYISRTLKDKTAYDYIVLAYLATLLYNLTNNSFYIENFWTLMALVYACKKIFTEEPIRRPDKAIKIIKTNTIERYPQY